MPAGSPKTPLPLRLSDASGLPYYRQITDQIAELVRAGRLRSGERLPSVRELAAQLPVSLITTRRAYADLEAAGLLVRRQGQGTFVAPGVAEASDAHSRAVATEVLRSAVARARQLGLSGDAVLTIVNDALKPEGGGDER